MKKLKPSTKFGSDPLSQRKTSKGTMGFTHPSGSAKNIRNPKSSKDFYPFMGDIRTLGSTNKPAGVIPKDNTVYLGKNKNLGRQKEM